MAIQYCSCNGKGCPKCRGDGFIDLQEPVFYRPSLPTAHRIEELAAKASSFEDLKILLGEFGSQFVNEYAMSIWMQNQNQRR